MRAVRELQSFGIVAVAALGMVLVGCSQSATPPPGSPPTGVDSGAVNTGPHCGNGLLEQGETCDDGNLMWGDGCSVKCELEADYPGCPFDAGCVVGPSCPNGVLDSGEECDDGNAENGDGCSRLCTVEGCWACGSDACEYTCDGDGGLALCGNGILDDGEQCDLGTGNGVLYGTGCTRYCKLPHFCGDGIVDAAFGESCDDGSNNGSPGTLCTSDCQLLLL